MQHALGSSGLCTADLFNSNRFISAEEICSSAPAADRLWHQLETEAPKGGRICLWDEPQLFAVLPCPSNYLNRKNSWRVIWLHMVNVSCSQPLVQVPCKRTSEDSSAPVKHFLKRQQVECCSLLTHQKILAPVGSTRNDSRTGAFT